MSAEVLRKAAEKLRDLCAQADADFDPENEERWFRVEGEQIGVWGKFAAAHDNEAPYIATMHPGVGLALADWLDDCASTFGKPGHREWHGNESAALKVARQILGGDS